VSKNQLIEIKYASISRWKFHFMWITRCKSLWISRLSTVILSPKSPWFTRKRTVILSHNPLL